MLVLSNFQWFNRVRKSTIQKSGRFYFNSLQCTNLNAHDVKINEVLKKNSQKKHYYSLRREGDILFKLTLHKNRKNKRFSIT